MPEVLFPIRLVSILSITAMQRHFDVTVFHIKPTITIVEATVVVGGVIVLLASNLVPQAIAWGVLLSVIWTINVSPALGVPDKPDVMDIMPCASPVIEATSILSVSIDGVALWVTPTTRLVYRLLEKVWVAVVPKTCWAIAAES